MNIYRAVSLARSREVGTQKFAKEFNECRTKLRNATRPIPSKPTKEDRDLLDHYKTLIAAIKLNEYRKMPYYKALKDYLNDFVLHYNDVPNTFDFEIEALQNQREVHIQIPALSWFEVVNPNGAKKLLCSLTAFSLGLMRVYGNAHVTTAFRQHKEDFLEANFTLASNCDDLRYQLSMIINRIIMPAEADSFEITEKDVFKIWKPVRVTTDNGTKGYKIQVKTKLADDVFYLTGIKLRQRLNASDNTIIPLPIIQSSLKSLVAQFTVDSQGEQREFYIVTDKYEERACSGILHHTNKTSKKLLTAYYLHETTVNLEGVRCESTCKAAQKDIIPLVMPTYNVYIVNSRDHYKNATDVEVVEGLFFCSDSYLLESMPVFYNKKLNIYYIDQHTYNRFRREHGFPIVRYVSSGNYGFWCLNDESLLFQLGYNVNSESNYSDTHRQEILKQIMNGGIMSKDAILHHLDFLMNIHRKDQVEAHCKWYSDRRFVRRYTLPTERQIFIKKIMRLKNFPY